MTVVKHGAAKYRHDRCRCDECKRGNAQLQTASTARRAARLAADPALAPHGVRATYANWGCRCEPCTAANAAVCAAAYRKRKAKAL